MSYTESEARDFINHIGPIIRAEATARGYNICSTAIAQAIVEGAAGTSKLAKEYHNHFGMKAYAPYKGLTVNMLTKEEKNGVLKNEYADFRAYSDDTEGVKGYYDFLKYKRYKNLRSAEDYKQYAEYLKKDGWATSSAYVRTLTSVVLAYNLTEWDNVAQENKKPVYATGRTYTTTVNLNIRQSPNGDKKLFEQITQNAKLHSYENEEGFAVLKKDSKVTCKNIVEIGDDIWIKIPSGYIAAYYNKKTYVV